MYRNQMCEQAAGAVTEMLEPRQMLAGDVTAVGLMPMAGDLEPTIIETNLIALDDGVLHVQGTGRGDYVTFETLSDGRLLAKLRPRSFSGDVLIEGTYDDLAVDPGDVKRIEVDASGGDDIVIVGQRRIPTLLVGGDGNDTLSGGYANDTLSGGKGDDFLSGSVGADTLLGNDGNDELWPGTGSNIVGGGRGNDQLVLDGGAHRGPGPGGVDLSAELITDARGNPNNHPSRERVNLAGFTPNILLTTRDGRRLAVVDFYVNDGGYAFEWGTGERVGDTFSVHVEGFDQPNISAGQAFVHHTRVFDLGPADGNLPDRIVVTSPDDGTVVSRNVVKNDDLGLEDDYLGLGGDISPMESVVDDGIVHLTLGDGIDRLTTELLSDTLIVRNNSNERRYDLDAISGIEINARGGDDEIIVGRRDFPVTLHGGNGNDTLSGGNADDFLEGGAGNDSLSSGAGDDLLHGGSGNDALLPGTGINDLNGGAGDDWFRNGAGYGWDATVDVERRITRPGHPHQERVEGWSDTALFEVDPVGYRLPGVIDIYRNTVTNDGVGYQALLQLGVPSHFTFDVETRRADDVLFIKLKNPRPGSPNYGASKIILDGNQPPAQITVIDGRNGQVLEKVSPDYRHVPVEPTVLYL